MPVHNTTVQPVRNPNPGPEPDPIPGQSPAVSQLHPDTQQGQPSGKDPLKAGHRLGVSWILFPLAVVAVLVIVFGLKFLVT